jgi:GTPase involved in cell partitioning and DNA repair
LKIADLDQEGQSVKVCGGGKGGFGNISVSNLSNKSDRKKQQLSD